MAKIEEIERRLLNWARWKLGGTSGGLGYARVQYWDRVASSGYREAVIPTDDCEAEETDRAVTTLASELKVTVEAVYLVNKPMRWKATRLCCSEATIWTRVWRAQRQIDRWLALRRAEATVLRARVEELCSTPSLRDDLRAKRPTQHRS